jgi:hypothetical protein
MRLLQVIAALSAAAAPLQAQGPRDSVGLRPDAPPPAQSVTRAAGTRYGAGWLHRRLFGEDYRRLWTTPIQVQVLDLHPYAVARGDGRTGFYVRTGFMF